MSEMTVVRVSPEVHRRFKIACVLRSVSMREAADEALSLLLEKWEKEDKSETKDGATSPPRYEVTGPGHEWVSELLITEEETENTEEDEKY